jgi:hypothetical protein
MESFLGEITLVGIFIGMVIVFCVIVFIIVIVVTDIGD